MSPRNEPPHSVESDGGGLEDKRLPGSLDVETWCRVVGEEGRGGGEVLRHLHLLHQRQEWAQAVTALLGGARAQLTEVHLDTEGVVQEVPQSETSQYFLSPAPAHSPDHIQPTGLLVVKQLLGRFEMILNRRFQSAYRDGYHKIISRIPINYTDLNIFSTSQESHVSGVTLALEQSLPLEVNESVLPCPGQDPDHLV